jgi:hypothetical protein
MPIVDEFANEALLLVGDRKSVPQVQEGNPLSQSGPGNLPALGFTGPAHAPW